jgi:acyl carrier protein
MTNPEYAALRATVLEALAPRLRAVNMAPDDLADDVDLFEAAIIDSFDFLDLISAIEEKSGISVEFAEMDDDSIATIKGLIELVSLSAQKP